MSTHRDYAALALARAADARPAAGYSGNRDRDVSEQLACAIAHAQLAIAEAVAGLEQAIREGME